MNKIQDDYIFYFINVILNIAQNCLSEEDDLIRLIRIPYKLISNYNDLIFEFNTLNKNENENKDERYVLYVIAQMYSCFHHKEFRDNKEEVLLVVMIYYYLKIYHNNNPIINRYNEFIRKMPLNIDEFDVVMSCYFVREKSFKKIFAYLMYIIRLDQSRSSFRYKMSHLLYNITL